MARTTVAELQERIDAMQEEIDSLRAHIDAQAAHAVQYVYELKKPEPVSTPLNFRALSDDQATQYAHYSEYGDVWGANVYL
jgi:hypothetical protein